MIDTNKLRRLAQAAMHPVTKGRWMRLFGERTVYDRMEDGCRGIPVVSTPVSPPHPFEAACLDFIAAANPAAVIEILDRLEAAEAEALEQARLNGMGAEREAALLAKLEAAEKERDFAKTEIARLHDDIRELTDVRVLDEEDRDRIVAWLQGTSTKPAPSVPDVWLPVPEKHQTFDPVDLQLSDGSVLCGCVPQSDGDYWWEGPSGEEVFIDPKYASVTHWRLAAAPEAKP